jgi:hypothetical protein
MRHVARTGLVQDVGAVRLDGAMAYAKLSCGLLAGEAVEDVLNDLLLTRGQLMARHERLLQLQRAEAATCPLQLSATEGEGSSSANYTRCRRETQLSTGREVLLNQL